MSQMTFRDYEYSLRKREEFLDIMNEIIPWEEWVEFVRPYYPNGKRGRPTKGIEKMLRMYLLQIWFNLSDEGVEDAIYDSYAFRKFMNIDFMEEQVPDATTLLKFVICWKKTIWGKCFSKLSTVSWKQLLIMRLTGNVILKTENPFHSFVACVPSSIIQEHIDECAKSMTNMIYRICFPCYSRQQHN